MSIWLTDWDDEEMWNRSYSVLKQGILHHKVRMPTITYNIECLGGWTTLWKN